MSIVFSNNSTYVITYTPVLVSEIHIKLNKKGNLQKGPWTKRPGSCVLGSPIFRSRTRVVPKRGIYDFIICSAVWTSGFLHLNHMFLPLWETIYFIIIQVIWLITYLSWFNTQLFQHYIWLILYFLPNQDKPLVFLYNQWFLLIIIGHDTQSRVTLHEMFVEWIKVVDGPQWGQNDFRLVSIPFHVLNGSNIDSYDYFSYNSSQNTRNSYIPMKI